jgi:hypothetical protein
MIIWGGNLTSGSTGGRYDPVSNTWKLTNDSGAPPLRVNHTAVWTGTRMIVYGGSIDTGGVSFGDTWTYTPGRNMFLYQRP